jgi:hypothetical protein
MGANLRQVNLRETNLEQTMFADVYLGEGILSEADLRKANPLRKARCKADLNGADLSGANLGGAFLREIDLGGAVLIGANLGRANLWGANLARAKLSEAILMQANLIDACLDSADLTGAQLWAIQRTGWSIKGVTCRAAFWDKDGKEPTNYDEGDFERIFAERPRIVLRYAGGISPIDLLALPVVVERLQAEYPDSVLQIHSMQNDAGGASVTITVEDRENRDTKAFGQELVRIQTKLEQAFEERDYLRQLV